MTNTAQRAKLVYILKFEDTSSLQFLERNYSLVLWLLFGYFEFTPCLFGFTLVCTSLPFSLPYFMLPHFLELIISPFYVSFIYFPLSLSINSLPYYILPHFLEPIISPFYVSLI